MSRSVQLNRCQDATGDDVCHVTRSGALRVVTTLLDQQRPFTAVRLGALSLLADLLECAGEQRAADEVYRAARPLLDATAVVSLKQAEDALRAVRGRPSAAVSQSVISDDLARVVRAGLRRLTGDERVIAYADVFAVDPGQMVMAGVTAAPAQQERRSAALLRDLWRRAGEIDAERRRVGEVDGELFRTMIDSSLVVKATKLLDPPTRPGRQPSRELVIPAQATVAKSSRYGNRIAASMGLLAAQRVGLASCGAGWPRALDGIAVLAAIAEAVDTSRRGSGRGRQVQVPEQGAPVARTSWRPSQWVQVLASWSSMLAEDDRNATAWRLAAHEANAFVLLAGWAMSIIGGAAKITDTRVTRAQVAESLETSTDIDWAVSASRGWELMQSSRRPADRAPWPLKLPASWSRWSLEDVEGLPWALDAGEDGEDGEDTPDAARMHAGKVAGFRAAYAARGEDDGGGDIVGEPPADTRVRLVDVEGFEGVTLHHDGDGWVMDDDAAAIATPWSDIRGMVDEGSGRVVQA